MSNLKTHQTEKAFTPGSLKSPEASYKDPQENSDGWQRKGHSKAMEDPANTGKGRGPEKDAANTDKGVGGGKNHAGSAGVGRGSGRSTQGQGQRGGERDGKLRF